MTTPGDDSHRAAALDRARRWLRENPLPHDASIEEMRAWMSDSPPIASTTITPTMVKGPGAAAPGPELTLAEWVLAPDADPDRRILYLHGGGYCMGSPATHRNLVSRISAASAMAVLSLDYRLAPEHPFPAAVRDSVAAFAWMTENGPRGPERAAAAFVAGDSAGGALAISTLVKIRDLGDPQADAAIALSPWTDMTLSGESWRTRQEEDLLVSREAAERIIDWILPRGGRNQPLISPVLANLEDLPPLYLITGDHEVLADDSTRLAAVASMVGVDVTCEIYPEMPHVFPAFPDLPESRDAIAKIGRFLNEHVPAPFPAARLPSWRTRMPSQELLEVRRRLDENLQDPTWSVERLRASTPETRPRRTTTITPVDAGGVPAEWTIDATADPNHRFLYLHGGGYVTGSPTTHRNLTARLSQATGAAVLSLAYRLAPENKFPAAIFDAVTALRWLRDNGLGGPSPASSLVVGGDSAGGGLTLATLLKTRDDGGPLPDAAVLLSPWTDLTGSGASIDSHATVDQMLSRAKLDRYASEYLAVPSDATNPLASPLFADLSGLPTLLIQVGDAEVLLDDSTRLAQRAQAAGVDATIEVFPEMCHVFQAWAAILPEGQASIEKIGAFLRARVPAA
jgi:monoterpene epsilon-lactone hydrolase